MDLLKFDHLESLEKSRSDWKIKVRVTRIWSTTSQDGGSMKGFNLILLDDDVRICRFLCYFYILL